MKFISKQYTSDFQLLLSAKRFAYPFESGQKSEESICNPTDFKLNIFLLHDMINKRTLKSFFVIKMVQLRDFFFIKNEQSEPRYEIFFLRCRAKSILSSSNAKNIFAEINHL